MLPLFELNAINVQDNQPGAVLVSTIPSIILYHVRELTIIKKMAACRFYHNP